jgi:23S rRNA pseudouridine1911/1915/1917 synthase
MPSEQRVYFQVDRAAPRLDHYLAEQIPHLSRSQLKKLIQANKVLVSNQPAKPSATLQPGEVVVVFLPSSEPPTLSAEALPLDIVFEDADLIVLNKAAGMVIHPAHGHASGTLVQALLARYPDLAQLVQIDPDAAHRPGLVHRLDRDTSGLMLVARTPMALKGLRQQFKARTVEKIYLALVFGQPEAPQGIIDVPLGRDPHHYQKIVPRADGKPARTRYRQIERLDQYSLLEVGLETGRTHQIRVHLAWLKCPVVGDVVYGRRKNLLALKRHFLHAWRLRFQHPRTGAMLQFEAPLPADLEAILRQLRSSRV